MLNKGVEKQRPSGHVQKTDISTCSVVLISAIEIVSLSGCICGILGNNYLILKLKFRRKSTKYIRQTTEPEISYLAKLALKILNLMVWIPFPYI